MTKEEAIFCEKSYIGETNCKDCKYYGTDTCESRESHKMAIKALEQEPKTGHWILADAQNKEDIENDNYRFICSECQCSDIHAKGVVVPYCWKCGAKMIELQESEGKK